MMSSTLTVDLPPDRKALLDSALAEMTFDFSEWDEAVNVAQSEPGRGSYSDSETRTIHLTQMQVDDAQYKEMFAHECGHIDDWLCLDNDKRAVLMYRWRYPRGQMWGHRPANSPSYYDTPRERYAEAFSVAFYPPLHKRVGRKWRRWAKQVQATR